MKIDKLIEILEDNNIQIWTEHGKLKYKAPMGVLSNEILTALKENKSELIQYLDDNTIEMEEDSKHRFLPFPLTDVQSAYLLGRTDVFEYGNTACHIYIEIKYPELKLQKVQEIWNRLINKHEMLRAIIKTDGYQQILERVPQFVVEMNFDDNDDIALSRIREKMSHSIYNTEQWPLFELAITKTKEGDILHLSMDFLIADWTSIWRLILEFEQLYFYGNSEINPQIGVSFRDYVIAERKKTKTASYMKDKAYWMKRIDNFYSAPKLPKIDQNNESNPVRFLRKSLQLSKEEWKVFKEKAKKKGITSTTLLLCCYALCIERWSENKKFSLNLTVLNRLPIHNDIDKVVGDFTSINLLEINLEERQSFETLVETVNRQLFNDLDHNLFNGIEVIRELQKRRKNEKILMPFVFTSAIGLTNHQDHKMIGSYEGDGISQTPQVFIDCQAMDGDFGMIVNWDYRQNVFPEDLIADMFLSFENLVQSVVHDTEIWNKHIECKLPERQSSIFEQANRTFRTIKPQLIHENIIRYAQNNPNKVAIIDSKITMTYGELLSKANAVKNELQMCGYKKGDKIAVIMDKSVYQVVAVLGTLLNGGVYVPIDGQQAINRRNIILESINAKCILTKSNNNLQEVDKYNVIQVDTLEEKCGQFDYEKISPEETAYIIFTSGSTGTPKGVVITHQAVWNTIEDINHRFGISEKDTAIGLSELTFDLSVYDIFGLLSVGGCIVYPDPEKKRDPSHWAQLVKEYSITIWNSVPAFARMFVAFLESEGSVKINSLRLALLSGDWIPVELPELLKKYCPSLKVISLGGATEASIWSIMFEYKGLKKEWRSIPYGKPLANQEFRILDKRLRECPIWVPGDLYITGKGLAKGYYNDDQLTNSAFIIHPTENLRMYCTGDIGRYLPDGNIEFLGRKDDQVKINGHRIEIGEVNENIKKIEGVKNAVTIAYKKDYDVSLYAFVESDNAEYDYETNHNKNMLMINYANEQGMKLFRNVNIKSMTEIENLLNEMMEISMLVTLKRLGAFDIQTGLDNCYTKSGISASYHWLVESWFNLLQKSNKISIVDSIPHYDEAILNSYDKIKDTLIKRWDLDFGYSEFLEYIIQCSKNLEKLLKNECDPIKLLYPEGKDLVTSSMYKQNIMSRYLNKCIQTIVQKISESRDRKIRILEIGAGTGTTSEILLSSMENIEYTFTDKTGYFITNAQNKLKDYKNVIFKLLDIDIDYRAQGFYPNTYDIIIAVGVLENAKDIKKSLKFIRDLITAGGYFLFTEPVEEEAWILGSQAFMMEKAEDDIRETSILINEKQWIDLLQDIDDGTSTMVIPQNKEAIAALNIRLFLKQFKIDKYVVNEKAIRKQLLDKIPSYMVPTQIQVVDELPLTVNGKIDIRKLEEWKIEEAEVVEKSEVYITDFTETEQEVALIWNKYGIKLSSNKDNFYEKGADSLIMAQVAGKIREQIVPDMAFDSILREILNYPSLYELCRFIDKKREKMQDATSKSNNALLNNSTIEGYKGNGVYSEYGEDNGKTLRVVFHAALGTLNCFRMLIPHLIDQKQGKILGISIRNPDEYYKLNYDETVIKLADDYAAQLSQYDYEEFQLIGYCYAGWIALEVGARLLEKGFNIKEVVLIDSQLVPFKIDDDLIIEALYLPNIYVSLEDVGINTSDFSYMIKVILDKYGSIPRGASLDNNEDEQLRRITKRFMELNSMTLRERFILYADLSKKNTGNEMHIEMAEVLFKTYKHTFKSTWYEAQPFVGDVRYLAAKEPVSEFYDKEKNIMYWRELCLGEFTVTEIEGNHYTCIETEPNALKLADVIGKSS